MKIVTYNVNGLRPRVAQHGTLLKLLQFLDADIICFQETKLSRRDLAADVTAADGYEAFFSCTRTSDKGRISYSGVATFCRISSRYSSTEVALPLAAEEGITGLLECQRQKKQLEREPFLEGLNDVTTNDLLKVDNEGRCIITDHGHFVLFNLYGPRAQEEDHERLQFKSLFFLILQKRWEYLLRLGKRVVAVGDLNIAPTAMDRCDAKPDFEENRFRKWFRSMLLENGGSFQDCFRAKHPNRQEAYTCWAQDVGAEEFNYGSRIDHIIIAGKCFHQHDDIEKHTFFNCHVEDCEIMTQCKRGKLDGMPKWKGGRSVKLEGSDHVPVYVLLRDIPYLPLHDVPSSAVKFVPEVRGLQQTIVSVLKKRQASMDAMFSGSPTTSTCIDRLDVNCRDNDRSMQQSVCSQNNQTLADMGLYSSESILPTSSEADRKWDDPASKSYREDFRGSVHMKEPLLAKCMSAKTKKLKNTFQRSIVSFFCQSKALSSYNEACSSISDSQNQGSAVEMKHDNYQEARDIGIVGTPLDSNDIIADGNEYLKGVHDVGLHDPNKQLLLEEDRCNEASMKWREIQQKMQSSLPLCKGHKEPCVARSVKKPGPNLGRGFYVCARAKGPASNPEANCNYFKWASSKPKQRLTSKK